MSVKVIFFASLRESLGVESVELATASGLKVSTLVSQLVEQHSPEWRELLTAENIRIAVNQDMVNKDVEIADGDEVAFFPPVTGG